MVTRRKQAEVEAALKVVTGSDFKKVVEQFKTVQAMMARTMRTVGEAFSDKIAELDALDTVIATRKAELKDIYDIEVQADTLEIWTKAAEARIARWDSEDAEHAYAIKQRDERDESELAAASAERRRLARFRMEDMNRRMAEKHAAIELREQKVEAMESEIAGIPQLVEGAKEATKAEVTRQLSTGFSHEKAMLKKDAEAAASLACANQASLQKQIASLEKQLALAESAFAAARDDAKTQAATPSGRYTLRSRTLG